ncbi:MAG: zinc-binding dehydrogenase [Anaerolineae bacterium]
MYRAAVMVAPERPLEIREYAEPEMEPGAILLQTIYCEVCGTDVHLYHGRLAGVPYPIIPGHVSVGRIVKVTRDVTGVDGSVLREGDVVTFLDVHETCGQCWFCLVAKASTRCPSRRVYGITYSAEDGLLGGWSEAIYLKPGVKVIKLPQGVTPERYIAAGCGLPTAIHALERAEVRLGDSVVIQGCGPVGLNAAILAQLSGATQIIVVGAPQARLDMARAIGADQTIDIERYGAEERIARVRELTTGRGADVSIEATGNPAAIPEGMRMTRDNGRYVVAGQYTDAGSVEINPHWHINRKHLEIRGCWGTDFSHLYRGIKVLAKHGEKFPYEGFITRVYRLEEMSEALADVERLQVVKAVVQP